MKIKRIIIYECNIGAPKMRINLGAIIFLMSQSWKSDNVREQYRKEIINQTPNQYKNKDKS